MVYAHYHRKCRPHIEALTSPGPVFCFVFWDSAPFNNLSRPKHTFCIRKCSAEYKQRSFSPSLGQECGPTLPRQESIQSSITTLLLGRLGHFPRTLTILVRASRSSHCVVLQGLANPIGHGLDGLKPIESAWGVVRQVLPVSKRSFYPMSQSFRLARYPRSVWLLRISRAKERRK